MRRRAFALLAPGLVAGGLLTGGLPVSGAAETATDARQACRALTRHVPAADVDYQPGIDVHGRAVVPADLPGSPAASAPVPRVEFKVGADLVAEFSRRLSPEVRALLGKGNAGMITVQGGKVYYDDQLLSGVTDQDVAVLCRQAG